MQAIHWFALLTFFVCMELVFSQTLLTTMCDTSNIQPFQYFQGNSIEQDLAGNKFVHVSTITASQVVNLEENTVIMIIQIQGGTINNNNTQEYGDGSGSGSGSLLNAAGQYEFNIVSTATYTTLNDIIIAVKLPIQNSYSNLDNARFQVVVVPLCESISINQVVNAEPWNGMGGGIISILALNDIILTSNIVSSNAGFRGGPSYPSPPNDSGASRHDYATMYNGGSRRDGYKGEGYIGHPTFDTVTTYPDGLDCAAGAPGNAGGGGTHHDSGGGGGGNGGKGGRGGRTKFNSGNDIGGRGGDRSWDYSDDLTRLFFGKFFFLFI